MCRFYSKHLALRGSSWLFLSPFLLKLYRDQGKGRRVIPFTLLQALKVCLHYLLGSAYKEWNCSDICDQGLPPTTLLVILTSRNHPCLMPAAPS